MKKLIIPAVGLMLAACTYQFAPTGSESKLLNTETSGEQTAATADFGPPATDGGFSPGAPGGDMGSPADADPDTGMPDLPGGGAIPGGE